MLFKGEMPKLESAVIVSVIETQWRHMKLENLVSVDSDNGVLPDGTKPSPEPMLIYCHFGP